MHHHMPFIYNSSSHLKIDASDGYVSVRWRFVAVDLEVSEDDSSISTEEEYILVN